MTRFLSWLENDTRLAGLLTLPTALWMAGIVGYPILLMFWMSLHSQNTVEANAPFVGLANYLAVIASATFWRSAQLTIVWTLANIFLIVPIGIAIATFLNTDLVGPRIARSWMLLPWMVPIVMNILMWRWIIDPVAGVLNYLMIAVGLIREPISFFANGNLAMATVVLVNVWRWTPFMAVICLAALQTVPLDLYEAARVDGATKWHMFWKITLPLIQPMVASTSFILVMWLFNMFPPIWLMTQGGPLDATTTLPILVYEQAFQMFRMSDAATNAILLLVIFVLPLAILYFNTFGRQKTVED